MLDSLTKGLNEAQIQAVLHRDGPLAVYAGAGSGKTRVIVHRIAHLLQSGVPGSSVMAVTFTNKAAREMKQRLESIFDSSQSRGQYGVNNVLVSTFHSAAARFLRVYAAELGYTQNFTIADDNDTKSILKQLVKELSIPETVASVQTLKSKIDRLKNKGFTPQAYQTHLQSMDGVHDGEAQRSFRSFGENIDNYLVAKVFHAYQAALKRSDAMDFNDLLVNMVELLQTSPRALEQLRFRYRYFLIDEFQDTNPVQFRWMQLMSEHTKNLCIVGDDDQSIYSWRGAEPKFIVDFSSYYPQATVIKLEQNYRSSAHIIQAASHVIAHNRIRAPKTLWTANPPGQKIRIIEESDNSAEGLRFAEEIARAAAQGTPYSQFAILYRTNAQSRVIEDELRRKLLPYVIYGSVRFYERAEIKVLMTYLRLLLNFRDDLAFAKCIAVPKRGFGDKAMEDLLTVAKKHDLSAIQAAVRIVYGELPSPFARGLSGLRKFVEIYTNLKIKLDDGESGVKILETLVHSIGFEDYLRTNYPEDFDERWLNVVELQNALSEFLEHHVGAENHPIADFLEMAALITEPTSKNVEEGSTDAVTLMTIHASKGLEFKSVYVSGLEEGVLPHANCLDSQGEIEEERRLLYVAMTRAKENLTLTRVKRHRFRRDLPTEESRFLAEIPDEYVNRMGRPEQRKFAFGITSMPASQSGPLVQSADDFFAKRNQESNNLGANAHRGFGVIPGGESLPNEQNCPFRIGSRIRHKIFGEGIVKGIEPSVGVFRLEIRFAHVGTKKLIHTYVSLAADESGSSDDDDPERLQPHRNLFEENSPL